jgi:hypothetical protein
MRDERLAFFFQEFNEAGFFGDKRIDAGSLPVKEVDNGSTLFWWRETNPEITYCVLA